jgi:hypothetical protein
MEWKRFAGQEVYYVAQAHGKTYAVMPALGGYFDVLINGEKHSFMFGGNPRTVRTAKKFCENLADHDAPSTERPIEL